MPIKALQQRLTQVGVIRLGEKRLSRDNKPYPAKLETFRLTSPSRHLIETVAELYGGQVRDWPDGPSGPEYQVVTTVTELPVYVLPQRIDPNLELWGNRHRIRLCDGEVERIRNTPCLCEQAARQRYARAGIPWPEDCKFARDKTDCKPTTRISVMLADVSDGQWKIESHGWNAAAELPTKATVYLALAQKPVPATLRMDHRDEPKLVILPDGQEKVESRKFSVPVLDFGDLFTARLALTGGVDAAVDRALGGSAPRLALVSATDSAGAEADEKRLTPEHVLRLAGELKTIEALQELWRDAGVAEVLTDEVKQVLTKRSKEIQAPPQATAPSSRAAHPTPEPAVDVVEAEPEPDRDGMWTSIMTEAKKRGWNLPAVEERYRQRMGHDPSEEELATGFKLADFLAAVRDGRVQ